MQSYLSKQYPVKNQTRLRRFILKVIKFNETILGLIWILFGIICVLSLIFIW